MWPKTLVLLVPILFLAEAGRARKQGPKHFKNYNHVRRNASSNSGLWPSSFNLATKALISVNATCGEGGREEFCRMVDGGKGRCGVCDNFSTDPSKKHPISYAIDGTNKWWQSPALYYGSEYEFVTIVVDLKQVYQITDVIIKAANSLRPGTWILERSLDDENYEAWQYFARNDKECLERFGIPATKGKPHYFTDSEVICTSFYSKLTPMENGEIHTSLMYGRPGANETSPELLQFTKARYVRLRLMGLRGSVEPLPRWFSQDISKDKRLFYTIRDISIIGHCVCNGHAENCRHNVASGHPECECAHHTCGPNCDKCCPMYNQRQWGPGTSRDAHQCLPCNCHGHAKTCHYDEGVDKAGLSMDVHGNYQGGGVCDNCTAHTTGINCERCMPGYYRPHDTPRTAAKPCVKCECNLPGSPGTCVQEGEHAGTCDCLPGYEGKKCDTCAAGYKGWPKCEACPCDARGVEEMRDCEGDCICKANVEGPFCDRCKSGHFALSGENPEGCAPCYCSDVTTLCEMAFVTPKQIQTLNGWLTTDLNVSETVKPTWDDKGLSSIGSYELPNKESLYWLAPEPYLANKLEYYGSVLTFKVQWEIMRGDTSGKPTTGPNIVMVGHNNLKIANGDDFFAASNATLSIKMSEEGWYHIPPEVNDIVTRPKRTRYVGDPVNRRQFLSVLANVSHILLRATFHTDQIGALLEEATMEAGSGVETVEKCSCPSGYSGLSCESCAFGYVRITANGSNWIEQGFCGKCDCNGHSESCNPDTGECFCQHNTVGENCERCKPGFYGNPLRGTPQDCKKCACPLENEENNFSPSCQLDYFEEDDDDRTGYVCTQCPKGYTGDHCEICDDGYFGNPMTIGSFCSPCDCNGGPCDRLTGQCLSCKGNTEGWRCERCKPGHYGDASGSNCMSCQCDPLGSLSKDCNNETGQCECKDRFTGRTCNKCETGYGNVTALCTPCACDPVGSTSDVCDQQTGLCQCRSGVEGFHCDTCQNLHYGLSESGCKECKCDPQGSKFQTCDQNTGKCICRSHYQGPKCDQCESGYWKTNSTPCTPCNCNQIGSTSQNCDPNTGNCPCKPGVQGQNCDSCKPKHYGSIKTGCKACDPCNKEGYICNPNNGKCVCPPLTNGSKCEVCVPNAWGHEPQIGCKACSCSKTGSSKAQCDLITGRCTCRIGFEGEKCNRCSYGYYGYPKCRECKCNTAGTIPEDCSHGSCTCSEKGCRCKANVEGIHCDRCKKGTFGLDMENSAGCIECFCSGRSNRCTASPFIWDQVRTSDVSNSFSNKCINRGSCWHLPEKFTGDLTQSYGGYLRISSDTPSNLVFLTGNGIILESSTDSRGDLKLVESNWKLKHDTNPAKIPKNCYRALTRACFMVVLQGVTAIQIAPKSPSQAQKFREVLLDKISKTPGKSQAASVERCQCPKEYTSSSCQDPNNGYYRHYPTPQETENFIDRILGVSRPCQCNNRSNMCDKRTGHCLNCSDATTGPHCEFCAQGHYRDASGACAPCLCPSTTQNFAKNCTVGKRPNHYVCECKPGYTGAKCDQCQDGFWGNPLENGGSCNPCNCNQYGSTDYMCDKSTGKCRCKSGFTGSRCSECTSPRQVIQDGVCTPCDECTHILFYTLDNLSAGLNETLDLFKDGLGPPWGLLNATMHKYRLLSNDFDNLNKAKRLIENSNLPKLEERINKMKRQLSEQNEILENQEQRIEYIQKETQNATEKVFKLNEKIDDFIKRINSFGKSHIDTNQAIREGKEILDDITNIINEAPSSQDYQKLFDECNKVFRDVIEIYNSTELNPDQLRVKLNELKKRLSKFGPILNQTDSVAKLARVKNKHNSNRIAALNRTINEINAKNSTIAGNMREIIAKIEATNDLLEDITGIYQALSKLDLENETLGFEEETDLGDLYDIKSDVEKHVESLQNKIRKYKEVFNFTSEEWKKIDASSAYDNLVKGIKQARRLANEARNITSDTLGMLYPPEDDRLIDKTNIAKAFSDRLQKRVQNLKNLNKEYKKTVEELEDLKHDILVNGKKNNELNSALRSIRKKIDEQARHMANLERAKEEARNISATIAGIEQKLKNMNITMQYELVKTFYKYLDLISKNEKQLEKIHLAREQLEEINVYLNRTKFDEIHDANANKFKNTDENMKFVQDMIEQLNNKIKYAYDRVDEIEYGLKISSCRRFYTLENDIFRSLEIQFECTTCTLLNLTNSKNEIITISVDNDKVHIKWKNQSYHIPRTTKIVLQRIGFRMKIEADNSTPIQDEEPFQIEQDYPLQVGDLNSDAEACLKKMVLNGKTVALWKFNRTEGTCPACSRNTTIDGDGGENVFFKGNGYRNVRGNVTLNPSEFNIIFTFATFDENSLIFLAQEKMNHCSFIALNLVDGHLQLKVRHVNGDHVTLTSDKKYNNGRETVAQISMIYDRNDLTQTYSLKLLDPRGDEKIASNENFLRSNVYKIKKSDIFVGGISSIFNTSCLQVDSTSFLGNLKVTGSLRVTSQNSLSHNIEQADELKFDKTWFTGNGYLDLETEDAEIANLSFYLRPLNVNDSFVMNIHDLMDIYIENSSLRVKTNDDDLTLGCISVNATHLIRIDKNYVRVNKDDKNFTNPFNFPKEKLRLHLGSDKNGTHPNFSGSIFDMFSGRDRGYDASLVSYKPSTITSFEKVKIGRDEPIGAVLENKCVKEMQNTERYHRIPDYKTEPQAFKFGDKPSSYILIKNSSMGKKFVLEFQFRTFYPNGLLFLLNSSHNKSYIVLDLQGGELRLRVQGHRAKTMKMKKVNDGDWHYVNVEQILGKKKWRLVVKLDNQSKLKDRVPKNNYKWELYVGGTAANYPLHKKLKSDLNPFRGCIRSLKINRNLQLVKNNNNVFYNNIGQCFQKVEVGAYFGGDAYAIYKRDFKVHEHLELSFELKTGEPNGILLSVSSLGNSPALSVELQNGAVVMTVDMGNGLISKVTNSPHSDSTLANNEWHNITAFYSSIELTVNVDGVRQSWVQSDVDSLMDEIEAPLYVGGLPNNAPSGTLKIKENFKGCIRKFKIEKNIMDWTDMKELNNVQLNSCLA